MLVLSSGLGEMLRIRSISILFQPGGKKPQNICPEPLLLPEKVKSSEDVAEEAAR